MVKYEDTLVVRIEPELKKEMSKLAKKWKTSVSEITRALFYLEIKEKMPDYEMEFDIEKLPHPLYMYVQERLKRVEKKKQKAA